VALLADACESFRVHCAVGIRPNLSRIESNLTHSLMLVTALSDEIGYDRAAEIAKRAHGDGISLRNAALQCGVSAEVFDRCVGGALRRIAEESRRQLRGL
jgi:fumarate hydratase class II